MREWTLDEAQKLCRDLEPELVRVGYHIALAGSVLRDGASAKDLDIIIYPRCTHDSPDIDVVRTMLKKTFRMKLMWPADWIREQWRAKGSLDEKHVEGYVWNGKRIDVFFLR